MQPGRSNHFQGLAFLSLVVNPGTCGLNDQTWSPYAVIHQRGEAPRIERARLQ